MILSMEKRINEIIRRRMQVISIDFVSRYSGYDNILLVRNKVDHQIPIFTWKVHSLLLYVLRNVDNVFIEGDIDNKELTDINVSVLKSLNNVESYCNYKSNWYRVFVNKCDYYLGGFWWHGLRKIARRITYYNDGE